MPKSINLVTGGAGFIGSHIAATLLSRGEPVRILDNFSTGKRENLVGLEAAEFMEGDVREPADCARACAGVAFVFHEAALPSVPRSVADPLTTHAVCAGGTLNLLVAARDAGVRRFVYAGSSSAYGDTPELPKRESMLPSPRSPYAVAKLAGEHYAAAFHTCFGLETVTLRYFNVFGPRQDPTSPYSGVVALFLRRLLAGEPCTIHGDGETSRDFTYVADVVNANLLARSAERAPGHVYNVGGGERTTLNHLYEILAKILHGPPQPAHDAERPGDVRHSLADLAAAKRDLGYSPRFNLQTGLQATVEWQRTTQGAAGSTA